MDASAAPFRALLNMDTHDLLMMTLSYPSSAM